MVDDASGDRDANDGTEDSTRDEAQWDNPSSWDVSEEWANSDDERAEGTDVERDAPAATTSTPTSPSAAESEPDADPNRIPLDLSREPDADSSRADGDENGNEDGDEDDPYAPEPSSTPIEAGDPNVENAVFVVLGAIAMVLVLLRVVSLPF